MPGKSFHWQIGQYSLVVYRMHSPPCGMLHHQRSRRNLDVTMTMPIGIRVCRGTIGVLTYGPFGRETWSAAARWPGGGDREYSDRIVFRVFIRRSNSDI